MNLIVEDNYGIEFKATGKTKEEVLENFFKTVGSRKYFEVIDGQMYYLGYKMYIE